MKVTQGRVNFTILLFMLTFPSFVISDVFMGEGKQAYIERCISISEMPGFSNAEKAAFCECFANKMEKGQPDLVKFINSTDSILLIQQKIENMAQRFAEECR